MLRFFSIASAFTISHGLQIGVGPPRRAPADSDAQLSENENEHQISDVAVQAGGENDDARVEPAVVLVEPVQHAESAEEVPPPIPRKYRGQLTVEVPERKYRPQLACEVPECKCRGQLTLDALGRRQCGQLIAAPERFGRGQLMAPRKKKNKKTIRRREEHLSLACEDVALIAIPCGCRVSDGLRGPTRDGWRCPPKMGGCNLVCNGVIPLAEMSLFHMKRFKSTFPTRLMRIMGPIKI